MTRSGCKPLASHLGGVFEVASQFGLPELEKRFLSADLESLPRNVSSAVPSGPDHGGKRTFFRVVIERAAPLKVKCRGAK